METQEMLRKLKGRVTFTYVLEKELYALKDYLEAQLSLEAKQKKAVGKPWATKYVKDEVKLASSHVQENVVIGGRVTNLFDFGAIRILEQTFALEAVKGQTPLIEDVYMTIDDGLGTLNLCMHSSLYEEMKQQGDILGNAFIFKGIATVIDRSLVDPLLGKVIPNQNTRRHLSVMVHSFEKLD